LISNLRQRHIVYIAYTGFAGLRKVTLLIFSRGNFALILTSACYVFIFVGWHDVCYQFHYM
jgi:hypothetical protein